MSEELETRPSDSDAVETSANLEEYDVGVLTGDAISTKHSSMVRKILEIAEQTGDYISAETIKELEELMGNEEEKEAEDVLEDAPEEDEEPVVARTLTKKTFHISPEQLAATKNVADALKQMAEAGKFVFSKVDKIKAWLGPIGQVAGVVKDVVDFFEEAKPDPVMKELEEMQMQLTALSLKMTAQFDDLKSFVVEQQFYSHYSVAISTLNMYLLDVLKCYSKDSLKSFEEYYKEKRPQKLVYEMLAKLEIDSSNPLRWAMTGDGLQSTKTFYKWSGILESVLTQALFLETFASGLLDDVSDHAANMILAKMARYFELHRQWFDYYMKNPEGYWPKGVENLVNDVHENLRKKSIHEKAKEIIDRLGKVLTADKFYVVVFEDHIWASIDARPNQIFHSNRYGTNITIYRSSDYDQSRLNTAKAYFERKSVREAFYGGRSFDFNHWNNVRDFAKAINSGHHIAIKKYNFPICGMVLMVAQKKSLVAAEWSGSLFSDPKTWAYGPGYVSYDGKLETKNSGGKDSFPIFWVFGV